MEDTTAGTNNVYFMSNRELITTFYTAFSARDAGTMVSLYADAVKFSDPAFGTLHGDEARHMWHMLIKRGGDDLHIAFSNVQGTAHGGSAQWSAQYLFGPGKRPVHNHIRSTFEIRDGRIVTHIDQFDLWRWSRQALGLPGALLGWSPLMQNKIRARSRVLLQSYINATTQPEIRNPQSKI